MAEPPLQSTIAGRDLGLTGQKLREPPAMKRKESMPSRSPKLAPMDRPANVVEKKRRVSLASLRESQEIDGQLGPPKYVEYQSRENLTYQ